MRRGVALPRRLAPFLPLQIPDRKEDPDAWRGPMDHHGQMLALYIWTDGFRKSFFARLTRVNPFFSTKSQAVTVLHERRLWEIISESLERANSRAGRPRSTIGNFPRRSKPNSQIEH